MASNAFKCSNLQQQQHKEIYVGDAMKLFKNIPWQKRVNTVSASFNNIGLKCTTQANLYNIHKPITV